MGWTDKAPKSDYHGTGRHYFHYPKKEILQSPAAFENLQRIFFKQDNNPYKQSLILQVEKLVAEIRKKVFREKLDLHRIFLSHDPQELGIVNTITFTYLLNENLEVPEEKVATLIKALDPGNKSLVNYMELVMVIHDKIGVEELPLFKLGRKVHAQMSDHQKDQENAANANLPIPSMTNMPPVGNPNLATGSFPPSMRGEETPQRNGSHSRGVGGSASASRRLSQGGV